mmetsp:Transcript_35569/g.94250  ORF Transcript_35569/g.94250 Transcript_35569/m.94250 type:complete len:367 (-) Transcript_35569:455-1555(-)
MLDEQRLLRIGGQLHGLAGHRVGAHVVRVGLPLGQLRDDVLVHLRGDGHAPGRQHRDEREDARQDREEEADRHGDAVVLHGAGGRSAEVPEEERRPDRVRAGVANVVWAVPPSVLQPHLLIAVHAAAAEAAAVAFVARSLEDDEREHPPEDFDELLQIGLDHGVHALIARAGQQLVVVDDVGEHGVGEHKACGQGGPHDHHDEVQDGLVPDHDGARDQARHDQGNTLDGKDHRQHIFPMEPLGHRNEDGDAADSREQGDPGADGLLADYVFLGHHGLDVVSEQVGRHERAERHGDAHREVHEVRPIAEDATRGGDERDLDLALLLEAHRRRRALADGAAEVEGADQPPDADHDRHDGVLERYVGRH